VVIVGAPSLFPPHAPTRSRSKRKRTLGLGTLGHEVGETTGSLETFTTLLDVEANRDPEPYKIRETSDLHHPTPRVG
jgi:hypothetical protein